MSRTNINAVRAVIEVAESANLTQHIATAGAVVDYIVGKDVLGILTSALLIQIETYLAAHFYALRDPQYKQKSTEGASGNFIRAQEGKGFNATDWGQQAVALDVTGTLNTIAEGIETASMTWLGLPVNEQTDYWDRN